MESPNVGAGRSPSIHRPIHFAMQQPKNRKYRKDQKGVSRGNARTSLARAHRLAPFGGTYGLKSLQANRLKATQIEAVRRALLRQRRKIGQI